MDSNLSAKLFLGFTAFGHHWNPSINEAIQHQYLPSLGCVVSLKTTVRYASSLQELGAFHSKFDDKSFLQPILNTEADLRR